MSEIQAHIQTIINIIYLYRFTVLFIIFTVGIFGGKLIFCLLFVWWGSLDMLWLTSLLWAEQNRAGLARYLFLINLLEDIYFLLLGDGDCWKMQRFGAKYLQLSNQISEDMRHPLVVCAILPAELKTYLQNKILLLISFKYLNIYSAFSSTK